MSQVLDPPAPATQAVPAVPTRGRLRLLWAGRAEALALAAVFALAVVVRLPYLWDIPRYTDELQEILWSMAIARGEILPLTAVDSYYGPLWSYALAGLFLLFGPSPLVPRLAATVLAAALVLVTYGFARDVAGRWPAAIAAGLLLTSGGHVIINSHTARSNSITPLLTTAALWLVWRALAERRWDRSERRLVPRRADPRLLVPAGLLLGLALQTHLSVIALGPGLLLYALVVGRRLLRTPWPYLAAVAVLVGYGNMILFNLLTAFWSLRHASSLQAGYTDGRSTDLAYYLANFGSLVQSLARLLSGTIESGSSPSRFLYVGLAVLGMAWLWRRGGALLAIASASIILVLPYFNPRYGPILSGRYLIPLLPLAFTAIGCTVLALAIWLAGRRQAAGRMDWRLLAAALGLPLVVFPLVPLRWYYQEAVADRRTNEPLHRLSGAILAERGAGEAVLLDEGLAQEELGAGGNDLKAFRMLLETRGLAYEVVKVSEIGEELLGERPSVLLLIEAKKRQQLPRALRATALTPEIESASGSEHRYAVYRLTPR